jgi:hypothetical protein
MNKKLALYILHSKFQNTIELRPQVWIWVPLYIFSSSSKNVKELLAHTIHQLPSSSFSQIILIQYSARWRW